jgi:hypothetical protein
VKRDVPQRQIPLLVHRGPQETLEAETISGMRHGETQAQAWERQPKESRAAYAAFAAFRGGGTGRTLRAAAGAVGKSYSLVRRWAKQWHWQERARAWDVAQGRDLAEVTRQEQREARRRQLELAGQLWRLGMAVLSRLITRDLVTGEADLDPRVKPRDGVAIVGLGADIERQLVLRQDAEDDESDPRTQFSQMSSQELAELIALVKERTQETTEGADDDDEGESSSEGSEED